MAAHPMVTFLQGLYDSKVLDSDQFRQVKEYARRDAPNPRLLSKELLRRGWMTVYQINQVNRGQGRQLMLGPYLMLERLGCGGMGEVLKARHVRMGRLVALKVIRADRRTRPRTFIRFEREVQSIARLDHPNIVHAYDAGTFEDTLFLAMEYLEGTDLKKLVQTGGPLSVQLACEYVLQATQGLQHAFERHVIHRDVKPSNLFLVERFQIIKILDMGLARLKDEASDLTRPRMALGTADYQAPEQIQDARHADVRSDLYSLGCSLYFLLAGRAPFAEGTATQRMLAHLKDEAAPIESLRPDVPAELDALLRKLLAKNPQERCQTPDEVSAYLTDLLARGIVPDSCMGNRNVTSIGDDGSTVAGS
jgi:serine/threonine-protein kinase